MVLIMNLIMYVTQVACGGNHTLAVCAHDTVQQEKEEKKKGYTQRVMSMFTAKPVTVEVPDSRTHSSGPTTAGSGGITPLDRISDGSMSLMNHGSNGEMRLLFSATFLCALQCVPYLRKHSGITAWRRWSNCSMIASVLKR